MGRWRSIRRWGLRISLGSSALIAVLAAGGWRWERAEEAAFVAADVAPPHQIVMIAGKPLHLVTSGQGAPGVLLISGLGEGFGSWTALQAQLSDSMRVVSYDRPGLGWSPPLEGDLTLEAAVGDIAALLAEPGLFDEPPILIGHSLGGQIARHFAYEHPNEVSGLILLDAPTDGPAPGILKIETTIKSLVSRLASIGLLRWSYYRQNPELAREQQRIEAHLSASASVWRTIRREGHGFAESPAAVVPTDGLGDLPLTVFLARFPVPGPVQGSLDEFNAAKRLIARESTRGQLIELDSPHHIQVAHPDIVAEEVFRMRAVVDSIRGVAGVHNTGGLM